MGRAISENAPEMSIYRGVTMAVMAVGNRFKPGHFQYRVVVFDVCPSGFRYISRTPDLRPGRRAYSRDAADDLAAMRAAGPAESRTIHFR